MALAGVTTRQSGRSWVTCSGHGDTLGAGLTWSFTHAAYPCSSGGLNEGCQGQQRDAWAPKSCELCCLRAGTWAQNQSDSLIHSINIYCAPAVCQAPSGVQRYRDEQDRRSQGACALAGGLVTNQKHERT